MNDQQLIEAANQAGLCFPKFWFLNGEDSPLDDLDEVKERYKDDPERLADMIDIIRREEQQRQENLGKLRRFAMLIEEAVINKLYTEAESDSMLSVLAETELMINSAADLNDSIKDGFLYLQIAINELKQAWINRPVIESEQVEPSSVVEVDHATAD